MGSIIVMNKIICVLRDIRANSKDIAQRTNRNRLVLDIDMLSCLLKYKASPNNYKYFEFYNLNEQQRQTYVTYGVSQAMINSFNDPSYIDYFEDKIKFLLKILYLHTYKPYHRLINQMKKKLSHQNVLFVVSMINH